MRPALMNRFLWICLAGAIVFSSCKKNVGTISRLLVTNATLATGDLSVSWSGFPLTPTALAQGKTTGTTAEPYLQVPAGTNNIVLKSGSTVLLDKNIYGAPSNFSLLVYDTSLTSATLNVAVLTDDLTLPDTTSLAKCRFIDCVPDTNVVDVILLNIADTVAITSVSFIGANPTVSTLQTFGTLKSGTYKPLVYKTGTAFTVSPLFAGDSITLGPQKICTLVYSGKPGSTGPDALKLAAIFHPTN
jgi:hypothetical protein